MNTWTASSARARSRSRPAHDFNDYEIGEAAQAADLINIMNRDATLNDNAGPYAGLDRFVAREKLWADMTAAGMTIRVQEHTLRRAAQPARRRDRRAACSARSGS